MSDEIDDESRYDDTPIEEGGDTSGYEKASLGQRLKGSVSGSGRSLLVAVVAVVAGVGVSAYYLMDALQSDPPDSGAEVSEAPESDGTATGEGGSERYQERVEAENERRVDEARESGDSAIPTLTDNKQAELPDAVCDKECRERLEGQLADAEERADRAQARAEEAQEQLSAARSEQAGDQVYTPDVYVHEGETHRSFDAEDDREERMRAEMQRVAERVTSPATHGYADAVGESSERSEGRGDGNEREGGGDNGGRTDAEGSADEDESDTGSALIPAATTRYATLDTTANTDVPSPVRATLQQGEYAGARLLGEFSRERDYLVIRFTSLTTESGETYPINAVALDTETRTAGLADEVDNHVLQKLAAIGGAAFIQGFGEAVQASGSTVSVQNGGTTIESNDALDETENQAKSALGRVGEAAAEFLVPYSERPTTVVKYAGTGMSILFLDPVNADDE